MLDVCNCHKYISELRCELYHLASSVSPFIFTTGYMLVSFGGSIVDIRGIKLHLIVYFK